MNLLLVLVGIFAGVALISVLARRFSGSGGHSSLQRWLLPLVGLMLLLSLLKYYV